MKAMNSSVAEPRRLQEPQRLREPRMPPPRGGHQSIGKGRASALAQLDGNDLMIGILIPVIMTGYRESDAEADASASASASFQAPIR